MRKVTVKYFYSALTLFWNQPLKKKMATDSLLKQTNFTNKTSYFTPRSLADTVNLQRWSGCGYGVEVLIAISFAYLNWSRSSQHQQLAILWNFFFRFKMIPWTSNAAKPVLLMLFLQLWRFFIFSTEFLLTL